MLNSIPLYKLESYILEPGHKTFLVLELRTIIKRIRVADDDLLNEEI